MKTSVRQIQLLTLHPGAPGDPLRGELEAVDVEECAGNYEAISYVWGETSRTETMWCNSAKICITRSLRDALTCMRLNDKARTLWADQICIDQDNAVEKSQQISLMDIIYRNARHVLVWLGQDQQRIATDAFALVNTLGTVFSDERQRQDFDRCHSDRVPQINVSQYSWSSLRALTRLPWFTRVWVIQEIGTKAPATLFWGDACIEWGLLHFVCKSLTEYHHLRGKVDIKTAQIKFMYRRFIEPDRNSRHANRFNFCYELHRARHLKATDVRDRVFSMLGHYSIKGNGNGQLAAMKPEYTKSVEEVYTDLAIRGLMDDDKSLTTLAAVQHEHLPSTSEFGTSPSAFALPSWAPDWRVYQSHILSEPTSPHHAGGRLNTSLRVDLATKTLQIEGIMVDSIALCAKPFRPREFHVDGDDQHGVVSKIWREVCGHNEFNLRVPYLPAVACVPASSSSAEQCKAEEECEEEKSAVFAILQTLSNACVAIAWQENQPYESVPESQWLAHGAAYLTRAIGKTMRVSKTVLELAKKGEVGKWTRAANGASGNRAFARTQKGYYVLGPKTMEPGDSICVLKGGKMPFCLRPWGRHYLLVGECYVHGIMRGELIEAGDKVNKGITTFSLL